MSPTSPGRPVVLCVGGSDPIGAAGIQADLRHVAACGAHGAAVPTALTVQGVGSFRESAPVDVPFFRRSLETVFSELPIDAVLVGMLATEAHVRTLLIWLHNFEGRIVLDPVFAASAGAPLLDAPGRALVREALVVRADAVLPNVAELAELVDEPPAATEEEREAQAAELVSRGASVVLAKGGHAAGDEVTDVLAVPAGVRRLADARIPGTFRGTGGALAAATAAEIALGAAPVDALLRARARVRAALTEASRRGTPFLRLDAAGPAAG